MNCVDVNVLVYAFRADTARHDDYRTLLEGLLNGDEPLGLPDAVLSGFLRLVTNRRVFPDATPSAEAWQTVENVLQAPAAMLLQPGARHWTCFQRLAQGIDAAGNDLPDAYLAAYALENNATWLSADRGFARFAGLRWQHPLDA